ncbi:hypothetical protein [Nonomuraea wenchangensis]|uniref:hypothetical protein n=1 Tax=Nonomuraea wenchangensis TaxID=568860 RepID=UPI003332596B
MTSLMPDDRFHIDQFALTCLNEFGDGFRAGVIWLSSRPPFGEVTSVADFWRDLGDGGHTGCDSRYYDATHVPTFIDYLRGGPYEIEVIDGEEEMREINSAQGTNFPAWPKQAYSVSFDSTYVLGFAYACFTILKMGHGR